MLRLYDFFHRHRPLCFALLAAVCMAALAATLRLTFKEDITDFLPATPRHEREMQVVREATGADRVLVIITRRDTTSADTAPLTEAADAFCRAARHHAWHATARIDYAAHARALHFARTHAPLLMSPADMAALRSLDNPDTVAGRLAAARQRLLDIDGAMQVADIAADPLQMFAPALGRLQIGGPATDVALDDGYIFTPDYRALLILVYSPYGATETAGNARLVEEVERTARAVEQAHGDVEIATTGGPVIAVDNARQIKRDSTWAAVIAAVLICALLAFTLRRLRHIALIAAAVAFGWLCAMAGLALFEREVSLIVVGIASVMAGLAVNYPLHFVAHLAHEPSPRATLAQLAKPLIVGNITTVGAFAALIPLNATALRDLGLFAALMLTGTIAFVIVFLPHLTGTAQAASTAPAAPQAATAPATSRLYNKVWLAAALLLTAFMAWHSLGTTFDTDLRHLNYLTPQQQLLLDQAARMQHADTRAAEVYVAATAPNADAALDTLAADAPDLPVASLRQQRQRIQAWDAWRARHADALIARLRAEAVRQGFAPDAFAPFEQTLRRNFLPLTAHEWQPIAALNRRQIITDDMAVDVRRVPATEAAHIIGRYNAAHTAPSPTLSAETWAFDTASMNRDMAATLSDNFNYIGWTCSAIVFLFLWLSFRSLKHAATAFLPMAVAWLWILGAMQLLGLQFNLVNIILATFIFGQGDDYSIFITEGVIYEQRHGRKILGAYKRSIYISATIMFIGIGTLAIARHPALRSLGQITILGMAAVVVAACTLPPLVLGSWRKRTKTAVRGPETSVAQE